MGSDSDVPIVKPGIELLKSFGLTAEHLARKGKEMCERKMRKV